MTAALFAAGADELGLALRATLLIGAAWAAAAMLRKAGASAATRHMVWLLGIAALLALPLFWWLAPPLRLPILRPEAATAAAAALPAPTAVAPATTSVSVGWNDACLLAYALGVAVLLLRFALCRLMVSRLWRDAEPARDPAWQDLLSRLSRELRLSRPVELRIARGPAMPMTWGTLAPKVLLPAEAGAWPPERRHLVLLHELAHVARRDSLSRSAASLACALYWFHPGAWLAARQMRMEQEFAADDRVLTAGAAAHTYALSLLHLARRAGEGSRPDHAAAMAGMCQLERRLVSITAPTRRERPDPAFLYASAVIAALVTLAVAAGVPVRPSSALPAPLREEPTLLAGGIDPAPTEGRSESQGQMPMPMRAESVSGGGRDARTRFEMARAVVPMPQAARRASEVGAQPVEPPAQSRETVLLQSEPIGRDSRETPVQSRQLAAYGPQLPRRDVEMQDWDARIPALVRRGDRGDSGNGGHRANADGRGTRSGPVRVSMQTDPGASSARPRLMLSVEPSWP